MFRFSLVSLGIALVIGIVGVSGLGDLTWNGVRTAVWVFLLIPALILLFVALKRSFAPYTMIAARTALLVVMVSAVLALLLFS
jgi:uncharacterized membrane protein YtjA (UPF0391 family)